VREHRFLERAGNRKIIIGDRLLQLLRHHEIESDAELSVSRIGLLLQLP